MIARGLLLLTLIVASGCSALPHRYSKAVLPELSAYYGVRFTLDADRQPDTGWPLRYATIDSRFDPALADYLAVFEQEFSKMPKGLIRLSGLRTVVFVSNLTMAGQSRAAVPDYDNEVLYYDVSLRGSQHARRVVHHEFYHMLEQQLYGSVYYKDPHWGALNAPGFVYGNGGASERRRSLAAYNHPYPGFINGYAMSGLEEDKAEIWTILWLDSNWQQVYPMLKDDCILVAKINYMMAQMAAKSDALPVDFWQTRFNPFLLRNGQCG